MLKAYLKYLISNKNEHSIHSPFVFDLYTNVIAKKNKVADFEIIEAKRNEQLKNNTEISITDFGAGSKKYKGNIRKIKQIAKNAEKSPKFGQLLYRLIVHFKPNTIVDLGTSLGITTLYQAKATIAGTKIYTFEGCPETAKIAINLFEETNIKNIEIITGNIDTTLPKKLEKVNQIDFAFFDANHRFEPTIRYFKQCLAKANEQSVFVFDDIHWSPEMEKAWAEIKSHPQVMLTIDLFYVGLVFFRKNQPKQHFVLRF
jgi:predicted O-methyltransferase YrrM